MRRILPIVAFAALAALVVAPSCSRKAKVTGDEARAIAKEAYIWGYPMVECYKVMYVYSVYKDNPEYKAPFNTISSTARVFTPADSTIQTPNSDTPYSMAWLDMRVEPVVITVPTVDEGRYYSVQLIDQYTYNFDYIGTRATGNGGGSYMVTPPGWTGETPAGVAKVIPCETQFALAAIRTQLFSPDDIENVRKIQAGYRVQTLSAFAGTPGPKAPAAVIFPPYSPTTARSAGFFQYLNFVLSFCPVHASETELRARFATLGIEGGEGFGLATMDKEVLGAIEAGIHDGEAAINEAIEQDLKSEDIFGTRDFLKNNYVARAAAAKIGLFGNSREEAIYPFYRTDADGALLDGANRYTLRLEADHLPPVNAFWSVTMYDGKRMTMVENPINRYLVNSPMLPALARDRDGGITLYLQHESPGKEKESNWLPAPAGPFYAVMRLYLPKPEALDGTWKAPPMVKAE
jgi:hypothetical protein